MPDDAVTSLDVQFGALQFGTDASPFDFTASDNSNNYQELGQRFFFSYYFKSSVIKVQIIFLFIFHYMHHLLKKLSCAFSFAVQIHPAM